ncbi:hypothetical protein FN846DRAFT_891522 [Sphaerosporella brunnea]|uniref:Uncharacterized protein n=1 Tax=Sphaerosporella brunnea TaxID=1250544 RepID=A0A5J5ET83_9PEZI|nr:hypothetical protein FN846DRAFT_891522 [Sphaerosporella brunnea]
MLCPRRLNSDHSLPAQNFNTATNKNTIAKTPPCKPVNRSICPPLRGEANLACNRMTLAQGYSDFVLISPGLADLPSHEDNRFKRSVGECSDSHALSLNNRNPNVFAGLRIVAAHNNLDRFGTAMCAIGIRGRRLVGGNAPRPLAANPQLDLPIDQEAQGGDDIGDNDDGESLPDVEPAPPAHGAGVRRHGPAGFPRPDGERMHRPDLEADRVGDRTQPPDRKAAFRRAQV